MVVIEDLVAYREDFLDENMEPAAKSAVRCSIRNAQKAVYSFPFPWWQLVWRGGATDCRVGDVYSAGMLLVTEHGRDKHPLSPYICPPFLTLLLANPTVKHFSLQRLEVFVFITD